MEVDNDNAKVSSPRRSYTFKFKLEVITAYYEKYNEKSCLTSRNYLIDSSLIRRWVENKQLLTAYRGTTLRKLKVGGGYYTEVEEQLYNWIVNKRIVEKRSINYADISIMKT